VGRSRGEIVGLRRSDIDLGNRVSYVRHQVQRRRDVLYGDDPKSRRRRVIRLHDVR
jgi:integrase